jgi:hypothetical protein
VICAALILGLHLGTYHTDRSTRYEEFNPGIYARCDRVAGGAYRNSEGGNSAYAGFVFDRVVGPVDVTAGVVLGYRRGARPLLIPSGKVGKHARVAFFPPLGPISGAVHLAVEGNLL